MKPFPSKGDKGDPGDDGSPGPAPSGTGLVSVTAGVLDTPSTLAARLAAAASSNRTALGLGNVDNTSDANKPVSSAQAAADALALPKTGGTMSGAIAMGGSKITGSAVPSAAGEAMVVPAGVTNGDSFIWSGGALVRLPKDTDGKIYTLVGGLPAWASAATSGATVGGGLYSAIPGSPAIGDQYTVSDLDPTAPGAVYVCRTTSVWTRARAPRVVTGNAVHHWRLDQTSTLTDLGSSPVSLTATGSSWLRQQPDCYRDYDCISNPTATFGSFSRLDATINIPSASDFTVAITLAAPANAASAWAGTVQQQLFLWNTNTVTANYVSMLTDGNGNIFCGNRVGSSTPDSGLVAVTWNTPHRIVLTVTGSTGALSVTLDGIFRNGATPTGSHGALTQICVLGQEPTNPFGASESRLAAADVQIWHRTLSAAEIRADWAIARRAF